MENRQFEAINVKNILTEIFNQLYILKTIIQENSVKSMNTSVLWVMDFIMYVLFKKVRKN